MATLPNQPLHKENLRAVLAHGLLPMLPARPSLEVSAAALRVAKEWAIAANLMIQGELTTEGRVVATKDPYLEATVTDWLVHFYLSLDQNSFWNDFVYTFLPEHSSFTEDELLNYGLGRFPTEPPDQLKKNMRLILRTYTQAITKNKFLFRQTKHYSVGTSDLSNPYTIGYVLAKFWERDFKSQPSVLVSQIIDAKMGLTCVLGITREQLRQQLDILAKHEIIEQRSAKPHLSGTKPRIKADSDFSYQVYRCWEKPTELLEKAYENDIATPNRPLTQSLDGILDDDDDILDFSQLLEWASGLISLDGGSNTIASLAS